MMMLLLMIMMMLTNISRTATALSIANNYSIRQVSVSPSTSLFASNLHLHRCTPHLPSPSSPISSPSTSLYIIRQRQRVKQRRYSAFHRANPLYLNRILFDISEIDDRSSDFSDKNNHVADNTTFHDDHPPLATVTLPRDDYRTIHVAKILGLCNGDTVRAGVVRCAPNNDNHGIEGEGGIAQEGKRNQQHQHLAGLITDDATISWLPEGKNKKAQPTKNGEPPGSLRLSIPQPPKTILSRDGCMEYNNDDDATTTNLLTALSATTRCPVSLLLALPRPLQLGRLLPMITQLGIHHLILTSAKKVPRDYFGSHILRQPAILRNLLIEGLAQSGDVQLPKITVVKHSLKIFMEEELDTLFPMDEVARVVAHPTRIRRSDAVSEDGVPDSCAMRMSDIHFPTDVKDDGPRQLLIAVG